MAREPSDCQNLFKPPHVMKIREAARVKIRHCVFVRIRHCAFVRPPGERASAAVAPAGLTLGDLGNYALDRQNPCSQELFGELTCVCMNMHVNMYSQEALK